MRVHKLLSAGLLPLALVACSEQAPDAATEEPALAPAPLAGTAEAAGEMAEALNLAVQELTLADLEQAALTGELACSFAPALGGETLFMGRGDVADGAGASALVKLPDGVRALAMDGTGGFDAMSDGARFTGEDISVAIAVTGEETLPETPPIAEESPARPATMTVRSQASEIVVQGVLECGP